VWVVDFTGYTFWHAVSGSSLGIAFVRTFSAHYPERLGSIQLIDPPGVFQILLKAMGAVLDERTASKMASIIGKTHEERMDILGKRIGPGGAMRWLSTTLETPIGGQLPDHPNGYFPVADTTPPMPDDLTPPHPVHAEFPPWTAGKMGAVQPLAVDGQPLEPA
jgi:hypothetical protein